MIPQGMTMKQYYERDAQRKRRRKLAAAFNARMKGVNVLETRTSLKAQLDHLVSLIVRRRDRCLHAGLCRVCIVKERMCILKRSPLAITQAYHILPRGDSMTRWDLRNVVGSCWPCNFAEKESRNRVSSKLLYERIHIELLGGGTVGRGVLSDLEYLASQTAQYSTSDLIAKRDEFKKILEGNK